MLIKATRHNSMETDWLLIDIYVKIKCVISDIGVVCLDISAKFEFRGETSAVAHPPICKQMFC